MELKFGQYFVADAMLIKILKLGMVKILNFKFCGDADVWLRFFVDAKSRF